MVKSSHLYIYIACLLLLGSSSADATGVAQLADAPFTDAKSITAAKSFTDAQSATAAKSVTAAKSASGSERLETDTLSFKIYFPVSRFQIDPAFLSNEQALHDLNLFLDNLKADSTLRVEAMRICGSVSPEGPADLNNRLVEKRADALRDIICAKLDFSRETPCDKLPPNLRDLSQMAEAMAVPVKELFTDLRYAQVDFVVARPLPAAPPAPTQEPERFIAAQEAAEPLPELPAEEPVAMPVEENPRRWHLKTNLIGWAMLVSNLAIERDFGSRFSVALPIYYSGVNYFTRTLKFRTFTLQPELRYWFANHSDTGSRWFIGAHAGVGWFNYALKGDYRIQDVDGNTPAWGGGLSAGYRLTLPWGSKNRWKMEFTLGVGVYDAHYDKWHNTTNGQLEKGEIHTTFIGIDQAAATLIFSF